MAKRPDGFYISTAWRKLRALVLRQHPVCALCNRNAATLVDHIVPINDGGEPLDPANLRSLCASCHARLPGHGYQNEGRTTMKSSLTMLLILALSAAVSPLYADGPIQVSPKYMSISGTKITGLAKDAGSAVSTTDFVYIGRSEAQSVAVSVTTTQTLSLTVTAQGSIDGTNAVVFSPAATVTLAPTSTVDDLCAAFNLPVVPYVRLTLSSDATYPVTYTAVTIQSW